MPSSIHPFLETALTEFLARRVDQQVAWSPLVARLLRAHEDGHAFIEIVDDLQDQALRSLNLSPEDVSEPLVYHGQKLYFRRFFNAERGIAARLISRAEMMGPLIPTPSQDDYSTLPDSLSDEQREAILACVNCPHTLITGGPGTGKTTLIRSAVSLIQATHKDAQILLAAPTGKAAARLRETLQSEPDGNSERLTAQTLHQLLDLRRGQARSKYDEQHPLPADYLFIDEASMIDLSMFYLIIRALAPGARLILVGDQAQLPAIEVGSPFSELLQFSQTLTQEGSPIIRSIRLTESFRFGAGSDIAHLASQMMTEDEAPRDQDRASWVRPIEAFNEVALQYRFEGYLEELTRPLDDAAAVRLLAGFEMQRILTPYHAGPMGVSQINQMMEHWLEQLGHKPFGQLHYHGRPILITENDHPLRLANGDLGICVSTRHYDADGDTDTAERFVVIFRDQDSVRTVPTSALPQHETSFAMSIHKSQGSEFDAVTLLLPSRESEQADQLLTRELLYTAVTRAKQSLAIFADISAWERALDHPVTRRSTLSEQLNWLASESLRSS